MTYRGVKGPLAKRFWSRVDKSGECWIWLGCKDKDGYGSIVRGGGNGPGVRTHRLSWELHNGPIPEGMSVCHRCDNPSCVRPEHLWIGTTADNQKDMQAKGRSTRGSRSYRSKMTEPAVRFALGLIAAGAKQAHVARLMDIDRATMNHIVVGRTWKHVARRAQVEQ